MPDDATLLGGVMLGALVLYALFAGADFGSGVWYLLAHGPRTRRQRELTAEAIAPIWEANHVWLILVVVVLFTAFPPAFGIIATRLHAPLTALLVAIVVRGSAFAFRSASGGRVEKRQWGLAFAAASVCAPVLLGMSVASLASGQLATPARLSFRGPWLSPFGLATGAFTLSLFAFLAAVYLTVDAGDDRELQEDFRRRALWSGLCCGALALITFLAAGSGAPLVREGLSRRAWSWPFHALTALAAVAALALLAARRYRQARYAAASQVALVVLGWGASQYPWIVVPDVTLTSASGPAVTQRLLLWALLAGSVLLFPSLRILYKTFKPLP
jgi:cytochrome d ubiquinol oxidase subunit II